ncbi:MAG: hypothetical protein ACI4VK_03135 [Candidatus Coproplasma sp.]
MPINKVFVSIKKYTVYGDEIVWQFVVYHNAITISTFFLKFIKKITGGAFWIKRPARVNAVKLF